MQEDQQNLIQWSPEHETLWAELFDMIIGKQEMDASEHKLFQMLDSDRAEAGLGSWVDEQLTALGINPSDWMNENSSLETSTPSTM